VGKGQQYQFIVEVLQAQGKISLCIKPAGAFRACAVEKGRSGWSGLLFSLYNFITLLCSQADFW
jgi:hypothetical protein